MSAEDAAAQELPVGRIAVVGGEPSQREELVEALRSLGHEIVREAVPADADDAGDAWVDVDAVLIVADERDRDWTGLANAIRHHAAPPPLVVLGPQSVSGWRRRALKAGAFLCASHETPPEELQSILAAAVRYRALEKEINLLRIECERICLGLLKSYGEAATTLKDTTEEIEALQRNLSDIRNQIIRAFV